eukprot:3456423-Pleurochrysis_carterae.AAC.2
MAQQGSPARRHPRIKPIFSKTHQHASLSCPSRPLPIAPLPSPHTVIVSYKADASSCIALASPAPTLRTLPCFTKRG